MSPNGIPTVPIDFNNWKIPHGTLLADLNVYILNKIDIINIILELLCNESSLPDTYPNLTKTKDWRLEICYVKNVSKALRISEKYTVSIPFRDN